jgi:hypothetical protein
MKLFLSFLLLSLITCATSKNIGHIDLTPRVEILRGNSPEVCMTGEKTKLTFFIHLINMIPQDVFVTANNGPELNLFGTSLTVTLNAECTTGHACYHTLKVRVAGKPYEITSVVFDCASIIQGN